MVALTRPGWCATASSLRQPGLSAARAPCIHAPAAGAAARRGNALPPTRPRSLGAAARPRRGVGAAAATSIDGPPTQADVPPGAVLVVGAGIAGLAAALALHRVGIPALVLEAGRGPRREGASISLWTNGFRALDALGVGDAVRRGSAVPGGVGPGAARVDGVTVVSAVTGGTIADVDYRAVPGGPHEARGVLRGELMAALTAPLPPGTVRYASPVAAAAPTGDGAVVILDDPARTELRARAVVGADGVRSAIASRLGLAPPGYAGYTAFRGVAAFDGEAAVPPALRALGARPRVIFGAGVRAGLVPLGNARFYWFTTQNEPADAPRGSGGDPEACRAGASAAVAAWDPASPAGASIRAAIAGSPPDTLTKSRIVDRLGWPWATSGGWAPSAGGGGGGGRSPGPITLVGDAAHPTTPNLAQGGGLGLEDAVVLARCLASNNGGAKKPSPAADAAALRAFEAERAPRAFAVTLKSRLVGVVGQVTGPRPLLAARDWVLGKAIAASSGSALLGHTVFDAGTLPDVAAGRGAGVDGGTEAVPGAQ